MRRGIIGALLVCMAAFLVLFIRLDDEAMHQRILAQLEQATGRIVHGEKARLSLQHGVSLKLAQLRVDGDGEWWLAADAVRFDLSLRALLFGDLRISAIDMVHPVLHLDKVVSVKQLFTTPVAVSLLHDTPVFTFRQGQILVGESVVVDEVSATVRRIEREQQTIWELQSRYAGGDFSSQGYIRSFNAGEDKIFGRMSATQLHINQMKNLPLPSLHYDLLDASLTFSLEAGGQWQWFGNFLSHDEHGELPDLSWRGKVVGSSVNDFRLHDAFVRFGDKTRLVLQGGCEAGQSCELEINTTGANPRVILKAAGMDVPLRGNLDGKVALREEEQGWSLNGKLGLRSMTWEKTGLPDTVVKFSGLHMESMRKFQLKHAYIQPEEESGSIEIARLAQDGDKLTVAVRLNRLDGVWPQLGDILIQQSGFVMQPGEAVKLGGEGKLSGSMEWEATGEDALLHFSLAADDASIVFDKIFAKPAGIDAGVDGLYQRKSGQASLEISALRLGESRLAGVSLALSGEHQYLSVGSAQVDTASLKAQGVVLPELLARWQGVAVGGLEHIVLHTGDDLRHWLAVADGKLRLKGFGLDGQLMSGELRMRHGRLTAKKLSWRHGADFADLAVDLDMASLRGMVNISRAGIQWSPEASLPAWLNEADIKGRFGQTDMQWGENVWKGMQGGFVAGRGRLSLDHVRGRLADGNIQSSRMDIEGVPGGVRFSGRVGTTAVRLDKLDGLANVVGAKLDGYLFLNASFRGVLPRGLKGVEHGDWSGNGDVEIHHGHWKEAKPTHLIQWRNEVADRLNNDAGEGFDRLSSRFHIRGSSLQLRRLKFVKGTLSATGEATLGASGKIVGRLTVRQGDTSLETAISGRWPSWTRLFPGSN